MNKKANIYMVALLAFLLFTTGFIVANFLKSPIDDARTDLNCGDASAITDGTKFLCLNIDMALIYFIILILSVSGGVILDKFII